ncbi:MAG: STAS domain-containing protein [Burkholderiaceae bacterium]|nr:STAS domain-containing protein [Burkholderiaceae bacterium]
MTNTLGDAGQARFAAAPERLTFAEAGSFLAAYRAGLAGGEGSVDLGGLTAFDSAGVGALVAAARSAAACSPPLTARFVNPPAQLRALADLYGVAELIFAPA